MKTAVTEAAVSPLDFMPVLNMPLDRVTTSTPCTYLKLP